MDTSDKDYIDAKLQAVIERLNGDIRVHQVATTARLDKLDHTIERGLQSVREEFSTKLAQVETNFNRAISDAIKWMIGAMVGLTMVSITVTSVLYLHVASRQEMQAKARTGAVSNPQPDRTVRDGKTLSANSALAALSLMPAATNPSLHLAKTIA